MTLITPEYLELQRELHSRPRGYGGGGWKHAVAVARLAGSLQARTVLDYGCGEGTLGTALREAGGVLVFDYDPAMPFSKNEKCAADIVVCTDVLEHIEPALLGNVLADIRAHTKRLAYLVIATRPANKFLADGRNAHLIVQPAAWWVEQVREHFLPFGGLSARKLDDRGEVRLEVYV